MPQSGYPTLSYHMPAFSNIAQIPTIPDLFGDFSTSSFGTFYQGVPNYLEHSRSAGFGGFCNTGFGTIGSFLGNNFGGFGSVGGLGGIGFGGFGYSSIGYPPPIIQPTPFFGGCLF